MSEETEEFPKPCVTSKFEQLVSEWVQRFETSDYRDFTPHALIHRLYTLYDDYKKLDEFWGRGLHMLSALSILMADRATCEDEILRRMGRS